MTTETVAPCVLSDSGEVCRETCPIIETCYPKVKKEETKE